MKFLYLFIDFFTIIIPLLFSFHPKIKFYKTWKEFFAASILVAVAFIIWDAVFTKIGVWNFDPTYLVGIYIFNLPLEEILFFICIPFACVFTYRYLNSIFSKSWNENVEKSVTIFFITIFFIAGVWFWKRTYTATTFIISSRLRSFRPAR